MMPQREPYGEWPASGEIDLMESRGMIIFLISDFCILLSLFDNAQTCLKIWPTYLKQTNVYQ